MIASGGILLIYNSMLLLEKLIHIKTQKTTIENEIYQKVLRDEMERLLAAEGRRIKEIEYLYQTIDRLLQSEDKNFREKAYEIMLKISKPEKEV